MVYRGKPSKGCYSCRQRKIKCDQRQEGCSQCLRMGRQCPGYRNQLDLAFENESEKIEGKFRAKASAKKRRANTVAPRERAPKDTTPMNTVSVVRKGATAVPPGTCTTTPTTSTALTPSIEELGSCFFYSNFCSGVTFAKDPAQATGGGMSTCELDEHLLVSMQAVGLASLSNFTKNPTLPQQATKKYLAAIGLINKALQSPQQAKKDSTLLAVMAMGIFETVHGSDKQSLLAWKNHVSGAVALVKLRGHAQLNTLIGRRMFLQATASLLVCCLKQSTGVPASFLDLLDDAAVHPFVDTTTPIWRLRQVMVAFATLKARAANRSSTTPAQIVHEALELDARALAAIAQFPPDWACDRVVTDNDPHVVFFGYCLIYKDFWTAQIATAARAFRLLLQDTVRQTLLAGMAAEPPAFTGPAYAELLHSTTLTLYHLQHDLVACFPQHIGYAPGGEGLDPAAGAATTWHGPSDSPWPSFKNLFAGPVDKRLEWVNLPVIRCAGSNLVLWAMFLCGSLDVCSHDLRCWLARTLRWTGHVVGINQATALADILETDARGGPAEAR
ncbi:uncharacterized protein K452DRAFT_266962 [Aplosporella prunicola CBS 121167]|uniref:Zn(2)-C6 fungal-type domain-containing protein n=1 Tax=Aplosporella prunicola CBS 121167 TaxID=1176127 RepID=A0A6A6BL18_9PEZI|nr:uncharacterized protein K452DRAFT_266962 [Aplosporella prunicola CBS 121167]KAF2144822.1 hypothetical protein K452DRAFT_266962 [Aplosporella prunicola CBS 121167]